MRTPQQKMTVIESIIESYCKGRRLARQLPSIETFAERISMTVSTMKRYFHMSYGDSIYNYYLRRKMRAAGTMMLKDREMPVNRVAELLGYEKTSNFIHVFKRLYGHTPGKITAFHIKATLKKL